MSNLGLLGTGNWIGILNAALIVLSFYFTLTFFEHLRKGDERLTKQSKITATICIALALMIPVFYNLYIYNEMMK